MTRALPTVDIGATASRLPYDAIVTFEVGEGRHIQVWQDEHGDVHMSAVGLRCASIALKPLRENEIAVNVGGN